MRNDTGKLIEAAQAGDWEPMKKSGWLVVYQALRDWWKRRFGLEDFGPYLDLLGGEKPEAVMIALRELGNEEWRPAPSTIFRRFAQARQEAAVIAKQTGAKSKRPQPMPYQSPASLARVRQLLERGQHVCECVPRPTNWLLEELDSRIWQNADHERHGGRLPDHVIRCGRCYGLEQGQVYEAQDALSPPTTAASG